MKTFYKIPAFVIAIVFLLASIMYGQERKKVIYDEDFGQLNDGAIALSMLVQSEKVEVLGVTSIIGNYSREAATAYALRLLEILDRTDIPVYEGAGIPLMGDRKSWLNHEEALWGNVEYSGAWRYERPPSYMELREEPYGGYPETKPQPGTAVDFIVETVKKYPNEVTIMAVGPTTNLALAIRKNPEIIPLIKEVIYMGGAFDVPGNTTPAAEFNWWMDPESAKITVRAPFKKQIIVPLDPTEVPESSFTKEQYDRIVSGPNTPLVNFFRDIYGPRFESTSNASSYVWDTVAAAIFINPDIATHLEDRYVDVDDYYGPNYGRSLGYDERRNRDLSSRDGFPAGTEKASILLDFDREEFWDLLTGLMTKKY